MVCEVTVKPTSFVHSLEHKSRPLEHVIGVLVLVGNSLPSCEQFLEALCLWG